MSAQNVHAMDMGIERPDGSQEWHCLACGRKILVQWQPVFKTKTIEPGDESAIHAGAFGDFEVQPAGIQIGSASEAPTAPDNEDIIQ